MFRAIEYMPIQAAIGGGMYVGYDVLFIRACNMPYIFKSGVKTGAHLVS